MSDEWIIELREPVHGLLIFRGRVVPGSDDFMDGTIERTVQGARLQLMCDVSDGTPQIDTSTGEPNR